MVSHQMSRKKKAEYETIKGGGKKNYFSKLHWYCQTCERMAVNFMRTMTSLHVKQQVLEERINQLEEKIEMKQIKKKSTS